MSHAVRRGVVLAALLCAMVMLTGCNNITGTWTGPISDASHSYQTVSFTFTDTTFRLVDSALSVEAYGTYTKSRGNITYTITRLVIEGDVTTGSETAYGTYRLSGWFANRTLRLDGGVVAWLYESATTFEGRKTGGKVGNESAVLPIRKVLDWTSVQPAAP